MFKRVLVATDFSAHADYTLKCIGQIPGMEEILLVHVIHGTPAGPAFFRIISPLPVSRHILISRKNGSILNR